MESVVEGFFRVWGRAPWCETKGFLGGSAGSDLDVFALFVSCFGLGFRSGFGVLGWVYDLVQCFVIHFSLGLTVQGFF